MSYSMTCLVTSNKKQYCNIVVNAFFKALLVNLIYCMDVSVEMHNLQCSLFSVWSYLFIELYNLLNLQGALYVMCEVM